MHAGFRYPQWVGSAFGAVEEAGLGFRRLLRNDGLQVQQGVEDSRAKAPRQCGFVDPERGRQNLSHFHFIRTLSPGCSQLLYMHAFVETWDLGLQNLWLLPYGL